MIPIAAQAPQEVELRRLGWGYQLARALLLVVGCISTPDLGGGGGPPRTDRRTPHETTEAECQQMGREWVLSPSAAAGGYCRADDGFPWRPPVLHLCGDAGVDVARPFCNHDAGDGGDDR